MSSFKIENIFGIGSFRLCSGFPSAIKSIDKSESYQYECPLNGCIQIYNYSTNERIYFEHVYDDIIILMLYNEYTNHILTCSYSGKIIIWTHDYQKRLLEQQTRINHVHYGSWTRDGTTIYLCSRFDGTIISLHYDANHQSLTENWLRHWASPRIGLEDVHPSNDDSVSAAANIAEKIETSNTYVAGSIGYEFVICSAMRRHLFGVLQRPHEHVHIHELNINDGHLINDLKLEPSKSNQTFLCGTTNTFCDTNSGKEYFAIGLQSGLIFILDTNPLQIHSIVNATGSPQAIIWWHSYLLTVGYISSIVNVFELDGTLIGSGDGAPATAVCHLHWNSDEQDLLWIGGYMGLALIRIELFDSRTPSPVEKVTFTILNTSVDEKPSSSIGVTVLVDRKLHETAGCGLYMENEDIFSGDLSGNAFHWKSTDNKLIKHVNIPDSIRCFVSKNLVGTLSGALYDLDNQEIVENFNTSVICSAWNQANTSCLIGLADGQLINLQTKKVIGLHGNNAEIWSVCWSPNEEYCATASEDQTTCIWKVDEEQSLVATLTGHTTAVTAVQWKLDRIYTCADDRTVRIYDKEYNCTRILYTPKSLFGWFTLTYLKVDEDKNLIICTTQNGYLVIWHNEMEHPILCKKIHFGSLEGLTYDKHTRRLATIGSDCTVTSLCLNIE